MRLTGAWQRGAPSVLAILVACAALTLLTGCSSLQKTSSSTGVSALKKKYPTQIDLARARAACLESKGWDVEVQDDASIDVSLPSQQQDAYERDDSACLIRLGADPDAPTPRGFVEHDYKLYTAGATCLREHGWSIPAGPTLQTFIDTYESDPWIPWDSVPQESADEAEEACPFPDPAY